MEDSLNPELLQQYAIVDRDADFENALQNGGKVPSGGLVIVKSSINKMQKLGNQKESHKEGKKWSRGVQKTRQTQPIGLSWVTKFFFIAGWVGFGL